MQYSIGYTAAWLIPNRSIAGGVAFSVNKNIFKRNHASFSVGTNLKIGMEDKAGTGVFVPLLVALVGKYGNNANTPDINSYKGINGGTIHLFTDCPLLLHFNFGLGSTRENKDHFGFYLGGGISYIATGFTNDAGYSRATGFAGWVADGGIRINGNVDIGFANVVSFRKPIGSIKHPVLSEITLSLRL